MTAGSLRALGVAFALAAVASAAAAYAIEPPGDATTATAAASTTSSQGAPGGTAAPDTAGPASSTDASGETTAVPPSTAAPTTTQTTVRGAAGSVGSGQPVTIAFAGDTHFEKMIRTQLDADPTTVLAPVAPVLGGADLAVLNLETAITTAGTPANKAFTFRAPDTAFDALSAAGVDAVSMANNHGLDFGPEGLEDSLAARDAKGFPVVGIGRNEDEAYAPWFTEVKGQRIALIGATQVLDSELITAWTATDTHAGLASAKRVDRLVEAVRSARSQADTVIVFLHWGTEKQTCPNDAQQALAPQLVEAGADLVVGSHAHRVLGGGRMGDAFVHYGLGNFIFYTPGGPGTESGILLVTVTGRRVDSYDWVPARISNGVARPLEGSEAAAADADWDSLRSCTSLTP